jgi:hypothetical protein
MAQTGNGSSLVGSRLLRALFTAGRTPLPDASLPGNPPLSMTDMLPAFALSRLVRRPVDWTLVRLVWHVLCVMSDAPCPNPVASPWLDWLRTVRRHAYGDGERGLFLTLMGLAAMCSLVPATEMRRHARRLLAIYGRDDTTGTPASDGSQAVSA